MSNMSDSERDILTYGLGVIEELSPVPFRRTIDSAELVRRMFIGYTWTSWVVKSDITRTP